MGTFNTGIFPASAGLPLGRTGQEWDGTFQDVTIENLTVSGSVAGLLLNGFVSVSYSATPVFTPSNLNASIFQMTLTGDVTSSTLNMTGAVAGSIIIFQIIQDAVGGRSLTWPANVLGGIQIDENATANQVYIQQFFYDGTNLYPVAPGAIY